MRIPFAAALLFALTVATAGAQSPSPSPAPSPAVSATPSPPAAQATTLSDFARARVDKMLRSGHADADWFAAVFLAQVPIAQVNAILAQIEAGLGAYTSIDGTNGDYTAHFAKGTDEVLVHLDADAKIDGLFFKPPKQTGASLQELLVALRPAHGSLSYVILEGRSERAALDASAKLAVGSAFKLAVLAALRDRMSRGELHWTDVVALDPRWKSLPSGVLRTWPDGTPLTLATYAAEMISISDNTAADALVRLVGPAALGAYADGNLPFLTTREMFTLKSAAGAPSAAAYEAAATPAARAAVLRAVDALPLPGVGELISRPILTIEWHYSVRELCGLIASVADLPLMSINPGVADPGAFTRVAYKGGSDVGVINLTTQVTTKRGTTICFSATLNDARQPTDDHAFETAYGTVLDLLAER